MQYQNKKVRVIRGLLVRIFLGGIIAGTLDIGAARLINGTKPSRILQAAASGSLGKRAVVDDSVIALGIAMLAFGSIIAFLAQNRPMRQPADAA